jgi:hypothetical protein
VAPPPAWCCCHPPSNANVHKHTTARGSGVPPLAVGLTASSSALRGAQNIIPGRIRGGVRPLPTFTTCVCASIRTCPSRPRAHRVVACPSGSCGEGHAKHAQLGVRLSWSAPPCADASCLVAAVLRSRRVRGRDALRLRQGEVSGGGMVNHSIGRWSINAACEALTANSRHARLVLRLGSIEGTALAADVT